MIIAVRKIMNCILNCIELFPFCTIRLRILWYWTKTIIIITTARTATSIATKMAYHHHFDGLLSTVNIYLITFCFIANAIQRMLLFSSCSCSRLLISRKFMANHAHKMELSAAQFNRKSNIAAFVIVSQIHICWEIRSKWT